MNMIDNISIDDIFNNSDIKCNEPFIIEHTGAVVSNFIYYLNYGGLYDVFGNQKDKYLKQIVNKEVTIIRNKQIVQMLAYNNLCNIIKKHNLNNNNWSPDWTEHGQMKCYLEYSYKTKEFYVSYCRMHQNIPNELFFDASLQGEQLTKAIAYFKVYLGIDI